MKQIYPECPALNRNWLYRPLNVLLLFFLLLSCAIRLQAQNYYPGGLGNSNLLIWLNADNSSSVTKNGSSQVSQWSDLSGHNYHFSQSTTSQKPVYNATAGPNSKPALVFTSTSSQYLSTPSLPSSISFTGGVSNFAVASFNASQTSAGWERIYDFGNGESSNNLLMSRYSNSANQHYESRNGSTIGQTWSSGNPIVNGTPAIYETVQQGGTVGNRSAVAHYKAGASLSVSGSYGATTWVPASVNRTTNYIARSNWSADNYFSGSMSELLLYNTACNTTQRVIVENYLSAKWNIAVNTSIYTAPSSTTYRTNLIGIGYTGASDYVLSSVAGSTEGLSLSSTNDGSGFLNTAGYIAAAHNGQANSISSNTTVNGIGNNLSLWNRSWHIQKTGGNAGGTVTLSFSYSDYNASSLPSGTYVYTLLYNATDGSFATGTNQLISTTGVISGNTVSFAVTATNLNNGYYTLLWGSSASLPVTLTAFTAAGQNGSALLSWATTQESNSDRFEIQRQTDGAGFVTIGTAAAQHNSTIINHYSFTDHNPVTGWNYYRLKMVDNDGSFTYSAVWPVHFSNSATVAVSVYPNPVQDQLRISLTGYPGTVNVSISNISGQVIKRVTTANGTVPGIAVHDLEKGIYMVNIEAGSERFVKKIVKQ